MQIVFEFIVVVFGILIALFINKLNEKRNHTKRINNIMTIVINNLNKDLAIINRILDDLEEDEISYKRYVNAENINEEIIQSVHHIPVNLTIFTPSDRGYNLLKDARVDFDFKDSELITDIVQFYNVWIGSMQRLIDKLLDNLESNTRSMSFFSWFDSAKDGVFAQKSLDYMKTDEYRQLLVYANFQRGMYKSDLLEYKERATMILQRVIKSDYK